MQKITSLALGLGLLSLLAAAGEPADSLHVWNVAKAKPVVAGAPRYSDVSMRSLEPHPRNGKDPYDTLRAARELHLTRLEWVYALDRNFVQRARAMGLTVGGALSSALPDARGRLTEGRVTGKDGKLKTHAWFPAGRWVGCVNSPAYQEAWLFQASKIVEAGADLIQQDDPHMAVRCTSLCYCPYCTEAFARYRQGHGADADYTQFQEDSVLAFFRQMRARLDALAGRHIPFSHNNTIGLREELDWTAPVFDFINAETESKHTCPPALRKIVAAAGGLPLVEQNRDRSVANNRRALAACYANGVILLLPWDVFMPNNAPRYFGKPEEYADLTGFVRANARLLDGYEDAAAAGPGIRESRYGAAVPVSIEGGSGQAFAFVRARPGQAEAPVAVHLVDWAEEVKPFRLRLRTAAFVDGRKPSITLLTPAPYDAQQHREAQERSDFSALSVASPVLVSTAGEFTEVQVPALHPWGTLVIQGQSR